VKLRKDVVISRTSRSKTISSIGSRSYDTHRRVDDGADAGIVVERYVRQAEAEQAVDLLLAQHAFGAGLGRALRELRILARAGPLRGGLPGTAGGRAAGWRRRLRRRGRSGGIERKPPLGGVRVLFDLVFGLAHVDRFTVTERRFP
jgi:hypothetical protein